MTVAWKWCYKNIGLQKAMLLIHYFTAALISLQLQRLNIRLSQRCWRAVWEKIWAWNNESAHLPTTFSVLTALRFTPQLCSVLLLFLQRLNVLVFTSSLFWVGWVVFLSEQENIYPGQKLWCTALLNPPCTQALFRPHSHLKSFCRWIERSDVYSHWRNVVRTWIKSWMPLARGLCQQKLCVVWPWKKHLYWRVPFMLHFFSFMPCFLI